LEVSESADAERECSERKNLCKRLEIVSISAKKLIFWRGSAGGCTPVQQSQQPPQPSPRPPSSSLYKKKAASRALRRRRFQFVMESCMCADRA